MHGLGGLDQGTPGSGLTGRVCLEAGASGLEPKGFYPPPEVSHRLMAVRKPFAINFSPLIDEKFPDSAQPAALGSVGVVKAPMFLC
jgi:hypothetical protein